MTIQVITREGSMSIALALELRGRMHSAEGQWFGRVGRLCLRAVSDSTRPFLLPPQLWSLQEVSCRFATLSEADVPRTVHVGWGLPWYVSGTGRAGRMVSETSRKLSLG